MTDGDTTFDPVGRFKRHQEEAQADSEHALSIRVLKKICTEFAIRPDLSWDSSELGFGWFNDSYANFPVKLETRRIRLDSIEPMMKSLTKSDVWKAYVEILQTYDFAPCGVIVNYKGSGLWIMHNAWQLPHALGYARLSSRAKTDGEGLIFESLDAFIASVKEKWMP